MYECRFFPLCSYIENHGCTKDSCGHYQPMPDVDALLVLANEIEYRAKLDIKKRRPYYGANGWLATAARIREALGE